MSLVPYQRNRQVGFPVRAMGPAGAVATGLASMLIPAVKRMMGMKYSSKAKRPPPKVKQAIKTLVQPKRRKPNIKKRLTQVERKLAGETSTLIFKRDSKDTVRCNPQTAFNGWRPFIVNSDIDAALANCRFFDPANPGTLITANLSTPTFTQKIRVKASCYAIIRNNYQVPCYVQFCIVKPRTSTSTTPTAAWGNGIADSGNPTNTNYLLNISDSSEFKELYRIKKRIYKKLLLPGQQIVVKHNEKAFVYDPSYFDTVTDDYHPKSKTTMLFYRVNGVPMHDTSVATEQGIGQAGIDVIHKTTYMVYYNSGGASVNTIVLQNTSSSAFTNAGVVSQQMVDNQPYSVA